MALDGWAWSEGASVVDRDVDEGSFLRVDCEVESSCELVFAKVPWSLNSKVPGWGAPGTGLVLVSSSGLRLTGPAIVAS